MTTDERLPDVADLWRALGEQQRRMDEQAAEVARLRQKASEVDALKAELERQRLEKVTLQSEVAELKGGQSYEGKRLSRAGLLRAAAAGAVGLAAGTALAGAPPALAGSDGDVVLSSVNNVGTGETQISAGATFPSGTAVFRADASTTVGTLSTNIDGIQGVGYGTYSGVVGFGGSQGGRGVFGYGGTANPDAAKGPGVVGLAAGASNPPDPLGNVGVYGLANGNGAGVYGKAGTHGDGIEGYAPSGRGVYGHSDGAGSVGGYFQGDKVPIHISQIYSDFPPTLPVGMSYEGGDIYLGGGGTGHFTAWLSTSVSGNPGTWVPFMFGNSNDGSDNALLTRVSTQQYTLANSDGVSWMDMDATNLSLSVTPKRNSVAIISGNSDLWTSQAGYNQDIGITVSGGSYPTHAGQPEAWKESGGFAGTFSPNAAFVQTVLPLVAGTAYTMKLQWKANKSATGATIWAGAGPIGGQFSPTRLTVLLIPTP